MSKILGTDRAVSAVYEGRGGLPLMTLEQERGQSMIDEKGKIIQVSYKVKPEDTVPNARVALNAG